MYIYILVRFNAGLIKFLYKVLDDCVSITTEIL